MTNRQIHIVELPKGKLGPEHFRLAEGAMPVPGDGELLLKTRLISLDAANRAEPAMRARCGIRGRLPSFGLWCRTPDRQSRRS